MRLLLCILLFASLISAQQHSNTLAWQWAQGGGPPALGFHIWRSNVTPVPIIAGQSYANVPLTTLSYVDTAVTEGQTVYYAVTAWNLNGGDSVPTNSVSCTTPFSPPGPATALSGTVK